MHNTKYNLQHAPPCVYASVSVEVATSVSIPLKSHTPLAIPETYTEQTLSLWVPFWLSPVATSLSWDTSLSKAASTSLQLEPKHRTAQDNMWLVQWTEMCKWRQHMYALQHNVRELLQL